MADVEPADAAGEPLMNATKLLAPSLYEPRDEVRYSGIILGAKGRKGFGSFADLPGFDLASLKQTAAQFRARCGGAGGFQDRLAQSPSLEQILEPLEVPAGGANYWLALDQLAASAQQFVQGKKHQQEKKGLGLPRRIGARVWARIGGAARVDENAAPAVPARNPRRDNLADLLPDLVTERLPDLPLLRETAVGIDPFSLCRGFFLVIQGAFRAPRTGAFGFVSGAPVARLLKIASRLPGAQRQYA